MGLFLIQRGSMGFRPSPRLASLLQVDFCFCEKETELLLSFGETYQPVFVSGGNELRKDGGGSVSGLSSREETLRQTIRIHRRHRKSRLCQRMFPSNWKSASLPSLFTFFTRISSLGDRLENRRPLLAHHLQHGSIRQTA